MEPAAMESIAERLAAIDGLYFPRSVELSSPPPADREILLLDLISRDPPIFLERYGAHLRPTELLSFETLAGDYSVRFHLNRLRSTQNPSPMDRKSRSVTVRNRRRAYMERLVSGGEYFSEETMRERQPYLHHEMLGRFQDPMGRMMSRPGERWSETLLRRCEEAAIVEKIRGEQKRLGVDQREWVGGGDDEDEEEEMEEVESEKEEMEEVESEEEESENEEAAERDRPEAHEEHESSSHHPNTVAEPIEPSISAEEMQDRHAGHRPNTVAEPFEPSISAEEMQDRLDQFTHIMQEKFLAGEDNEHLDYSKIDDDERLDDHWFKEATQDAEDKYFDAEDEYLDED